MLDGTWTTFGDTDRDGLREIVTLDYTSNWHLAIVERQPDNSYVTSYPLGPGYLLTYATGDLDGDGKMEIIGQNGNRVLVYESVDGTSFPSALVWTSPPLTNVAGQTTVGDSDGDGRMEIIHSQNYFSGTARLVIFENRGDNEYTEVFNAPTPGNAATGEKVVLDMDQDGRKEIAVCGVYGFLYVFEAVGDDQWQQVWTDSTGLTTAYAAEGGTDSDGNGRPELFIHGNDFSVFPSRTWPARVYEAVADNKFRLVTTIPVPGYGSGRPVDASGDLDGDGDREYIALETRPVWDPPPGGLWIYTAVSPGVWQAVAMLENPENSMGDAFTYDMNANGKSEILWLASSTTAGETSQLWEHEATSDVGTLPRGTSLAVFPNPILRTARIQWRRTDPVAAALLVYDVAGRLVERYDTRGNSIEWRPARVPSGVYFIRLLDARGVALASARALVVSSE